MAVYNYKLLIENYKDEILKTIKKSRVCVLKGPTGCGKSTYIPYILSSKATRMAIIEPRRIAVTSLYKTISKVIEDVGYKMRFDKIINKETRTIIYTDGSFLNEIGNMNFDYIIIDEVHERSVRTDIILGMLKSNIEKIKSKIILMSATVDTDKIAKYFNASVLEIPGMLYLSKVEYSSEYVSDYIVEAYCVIKKIISKKQDTWDGFEVANRDILVFLPGEEDINELYILLRKLLVIKVYKIFSTLSDKEQNKIYETSNLRKVILSTNICETSLTIPGVGYVIDSGLHKIKIYDQINYLGIQPISKESASQRLGRCNRTGPGVCYRLYPEEMYNTLPLQIPEICRSDLSQVFLQLIGHRKDIFKLDFLDYPTRLNSINGLKLLLKKNCVRIIDNIEKKELKESDFPKYMGLLSSLSSSDKEIKAKKIEIDINRIQLKITNYGKVLLQHPFDINLSHFYQQSLNKNVGYFASVILSLISQSNYNFLRNLDKTHGTDIEFLINLFEMYLEAKNKRLYCLKNEVSMKGMEMASRIFSKLNKKKERNIEVLEKVFSYSYKHNLSERVGNGSYKHLESGNIVWIHPRSCFFKRQDKFIVFVDIFYTNKPYARIVGKYFKDVGSEWEIPTYK